MMKLLAGKVAFITGASRGIGKAIALAFAEQGADIVFTATKDSDAVKSVINEMLELGAKVKFIPYDVSSLKETEIAVNNALSEFGKIDVLVNNAGITKDNLLMRMSEADWDNVINTNLKSVFNHCKVIIPAMMKQRSGSIINISSVVGISGNMGQTNYAAAKAGIIGFTKAMSKEVGSRNIRCNAIAPGFIGTEMTDKLPEDLKNNWIQKISLRRIGTTQDVANSALFLASDLSSYITGQVLVCDGGMQG
jgi:3-oxoacyl-[acyl-carrier protein] reductase